MLAVHGALAWVVVVLNLAVGIWGLLVARRRDPTPKAFWPAILAGQLALAAQVSFGLVLFQSRRPSGIHVFYGFVLATAAALSWAFRGEGPRRARTVASAVALFIGAVAIRAVTTA